MSIKNITVTLSKTEVETIIKDYLQREMPGYNAKGVDFKLTTQYSGYGQMESSERVFSSVEATMEAQTRKSAIVSDQRDSATSWYDR